MNRRCEAPPARRDRHKARFAAGRWRRGTTPRLARSEAGTLSAAASSCMVACSCGTCPGTTAWLRRGTGNYGVGVRVVAEVAALLVEHRGSVLVSWQPLGQPVLTEEHVGGDDALVHDEGAVLEVHAVRATDFASHVALYEENVYGLENVANLDGLPATRATVIALPMKLEGGSGGPVRIVAHLPEWPPGHSAPSTAPPLRVSPLRCHAHADKPHVR